MKKENGAEGSEVFRISMTESLYKSLTTSVPESPKWKNMHYFILNYPFIVIEVNAVLMIH